MYSIVLIIGTVIFSIIVSLIFYTKKTDKVISLLTEILIELGLIDNQKEISSPFNVHHKVHVNLNFNWKGEDPHTLFEKVEKIGSGAFGSVYKAIHRESNFVIALKTIEIEDGDEEEMNDLQAEIDVLKLCNFPNIVKYYGCYFNSNELLIMMEYCEIGSVRDAMICIKRTLTEEEISFICFGALKALSYMHASTPIIVHRDIKAANILLDSSGNVKLADFGVSDRIEKTVRPSGYAGTPHWMAPEMLRKGECNHKIDIWGLGITAIEMAEGAPPRTELNPYQAIARIPNLPPPKLKDSQKWSKDFVDFLSKCLVKDYKERASAKDLLSHPFIIKASLKPDSLSKFIKEVKEQRESSKNKESEEMTAETLVIADTTKSSLINTDDSSIVDSVQTMVILDENQETGHLAHIKIEATKYDENKLKNDSSKHSIGKKIKNYVHVGTQTEKSTVYYLKYYSKIIILSLLMAIFWNIMYSAIGNKDVHEPSLPRLEI